MEVARDPDRAFNRVRRLVVSGPPIGRKSDPSRHASGEKWIVACRPWPCVRKKTAAPRHFIDVRVPCIPMSANASL